MVHEKKNRFDILSFVSKVEWKKKCGREFKLAERMKLFVICIQNFCALILYLYIGNICLNSSVNQFDVQCDLCIYLFACVFRFSILCHNLWLLLQEFVPFFRWLHMEKYKENVYMIKINASYADTETQQLFITKSHCFDFSSYTE